MKILNPRTYLIIALSFLFMAIWNNHKKGTDRKLLERITKEIQNSESWNEEFLVYRIQIELELCEEKIKRNNDITTFEEQIQDSGNDTIYNESCMAKMLSSLTKEDIDKLKYEAKNFIDEGMDQNEIDLYKNEVIFIFIIIEKWEEWHTRQNKIQQTTLSTSHSR